MHRRRLRPQIARKASKSPLHLRASGLWPEASLCALEIEEMGVSHRIHGPAAWRRTWLVDELVNTFPLLYRYLPEAQGERKAGEGGMDSSGQKAFPHPWSVPFGAALLDLALQARPHHTVMLPQNPMIDPSTSTEAD